MKTWQAILLVAIWFVGLAFILFYTDLPTSNVIWGSEVTIPLWILNMIAIIWLIYPFIIFRRYMFPDLMGQ